MFRRVAAVALSMALSPALHGQAAECVGSIAIATFRLAAAPSTSGSPVWMPLRQVNNLPAGYRVRYQPGSVPSDMSKDGAIALVLVPKTGDGQMQVMQPGSAATTTEWILPFDASVVLLVFAPQGFDEKRLTNVVSRDPDLISALAEYADQTRDLETTLEALRHLDDEAEEALEPGRAGTPTELALLALVRALNPAVSTYNPLGAGRRAGPTSMMGRGASTFFENAGGTFPGSGILPMAKQFLMPDAEFRSVYGAGADGGSMTLCAQRQAPTRNKLAYVWAYRLTNAPAPVAQVVGNVVDVPMGRRTSVPLKIQGSASWDLLSRVTDWGLVSPSGGAPLHISARTSVATHALHLDLRGFAGLPGLYAIEGRWDWGAIRLNGALQLHQLDDLRAAAITPDSQEKLVVNTGLVALDLTGANLRFVERAWLHRPESERRIAVDLPAKRTGAADHLRVEVDTDRLRPGRYLLTLTRIDGEATDIPVQLLAAVPRLEGGVLWLHAGENPETVILRGSGLDQIEGLESPLAVIELGPATPDGTRREALVRLRPATVAGARLDLDARIAGRIGLLRLPAVFQVAPPRPRIISGRTAPPVDLPFTLREGELPAGSYVSFTLRYESSTPPTLSLKCDGSAAAAPQSYATPEAGSLFFAMDPGTIGNTGCKLLAVLEAGESGSSEPLALGTVLRVPRIEKLTLTNEAAPGGFVGVIEGWDLETIERTGWNATLGLPAPELPRALSGQGAKQTLRVAMPWPSPAPKSPLFVFLRGESQGRATRITQ